VTTKLSDSLNINLAADLIYELNLKEKFKEGLKYSDSLIQVSKNIGYYKGVGKLHNEKASIYIKTDELYKSFISFDEAEINFKKINFYRGLAIIQHNKAVIEQVVFDYFT